MKNIKVSSEMERKIIAFCDDELNYHINESGCADEYEDEIEAEIFLLTQLGCTDIADHYKEQYEAFKKNELYDNDIVALSDDEVIYAFIDDHLEEFVDFDPFEDQNGDDYRLAYDMVEKYMETLSKKEKKEIADGLRSNPQLYECYECKICERESFN